MVLIDLGIISSGEKSGNIVFCGETSLSGSVTITF